MKLDFVCTVVVHGLGMGNKRYIHKFDLENCAQIEQTVPGERQFVMAEPVDFANYVYLRTVPMSDVIIGLIYLWGGFLAWVLTTTQNSDRAHTKRAHPRKQTHHLH